MTNFKTPTQYIRKWYNLTYSDEWKPIINEKFPSSLSFLSCNFFFTAIWRSVYVLELFAEDEMNIAE